MPNLLKIYHDHHKIWQLKQLVETVAYDRGIYLFDELLIRNTTYLDIYDSILRRMRIHTM